MKRLTTIVLLLCSFQFCHAQLVVNAYDNNEALIGQPELAANSNILMVVRPDDIAIRVDFKSGEIASTSLDPTPGNNTIAFEQINCQGPAYLLTTNVQPLDWISTYLSPDTPAPLFQLMKGTTPAPVDLVSLTTEFEPGCGNIGTDPIDGVPVTLITDPSQLGFIITPSGNWGYAPPLSIKSTTIKPPSEVVFCDNFESCPTP